MTKKFLIIALITVFCCIFAFSVCAEESVSPVTDTYYLVQTKDSEAAQALISNGKNVIIYEEMLSATSYGTVSPFFSQFAEGSHVEIIFAEDIFVSKTLLPTNIGIFINVPITVTFSYNGFSHYIDNAGSSSMNGIVVRNSNAFVRLIGTKAMDADGNFSQEFSSPNGDVADGTFNVNGCYTDLFKYAGNYLDVYTGKIYLENIRSYTKDATIKTHNENSPTIIVKNCALYSSSGRSLNFTEQSTKTVMVEGGYYKGLIGYSILTGSYVKDCVVIETNLQIDTWGLTRNYWEFINCDLSNTTKISSSTGRTNYIFRDCTFNENLSWSLSGDGGGDQFARVYTSPTCTEAGTLVIYRSYNKGTGNLHEDELANYSSLNPALGHIEADGKISVSDYLANSIVTALCTRCNSEYQYESDPLFKCLGFSYFENEASPSICIGFVADYTKIAQYEADSGVFLDFGVIATSQASLGTGNAPLDANGDPIPLKSGNIIKASLCGATNTNIGAFTMKVILTQAHADTMLLMSGYIMETKDGENTVYYMQKGDATVSNNAYEYVSYNSLITNAK